MKWKSQVPKAGTCVQRSLKPWKAFSMERVGLQNGMHTLGSKEKGPEKAKARRPVRRLFRVPVPEMNE